MRQMDEEELAVIAEVARMYYIEGMSQLDIANILFFSKAKVSRALRIAREKHIVEFQINYPLKRSIQLETKLKREFGLKEALVVSDLYDNQSTEISIKRIGEMAANYLDETLKDGDSIGLAWGRTMHQTVRQLKPSSPRRIQVLQLMGNSMDDYNLEIDVTTLTEGMARAFQGTAVRLYAPMYVNSDIVRKELLREPIIRKTMDKIRNVDYAMTGIADVSLEYPKSTWAGYLTEHKKQDLIRKGAVGYLCGYFLDKNGNKLSDPINDKIIGISFEDLKKVPYVIAVAGGLDKTNSILAALRGNLIHCLITDSRIAQKLLAARDH